MLDGIQPLTGVRPKETHKRSEKDELDDDFMPDERIKSRTADLKPAEENLLRDLVIDGHNRGLLLTKTEAR